MADMSAISIAINGVNNLSGPVGGAIGSLNSLEGAAGKMGGALVGVAETALKAAAAVTALGAAAAVGFTASAVKVAADFEQQLSAIAAVSSKAEVATVGGMKAIGDAALQLGKDTSFSATEAAAGMEEMVKAGVSLTDVIGGGARAALDLAAAGSLSVAEAATVASNAMNAFALAGKDLPHIADALAGASVASATDVHQLGFALASVGAVAHGIGLSFDDTTTAISLFAQAGLRGSDAGTSFKTMLLNLTPQTKAQIAVARELGIVTEDGSNQFYDAAGNVKSFAGISEVLQRATKNLTAEQKTNALQTLFGTDAIRSALIMSEQGAVGVGKMADAWHAAGGAGAIAAERLNNLKGSLEKLGGTYEVIRIKFGSPFLPIFKVAVDALTDALNKNEPAITAFAERAAAGLDVLITRAIAAGPRFLAMGAGLLAFGRQGLALAQSVLPKVIEQFKALTSGLSFGGVASGAGSFISGLIGAFKRIEPVVMSVGRAIYANIVETFNFLTTRVLPPVVSIIQQIGNVLTSTLLPAAAQTGAVMRGIFGDTLDWLAKTVMPPFLSIVTQTSNFFTGVMLPTLPAIATAIRTTLGETVQWLATDVWPKLTAAATLAWGYISGTIIPALPGFAAQIRGALGTALEWVGKTGWPMLVTGATIAWAFLTDKMIPVVSDVISWLKEKLPPAIEAVTTAWEAVRSRVQPIIEALFNGDIKTAISQAGAAFSEFGTLALGWITEQVAKIDWAAVWATSKDVALTLGTYVAGLAVDFATWLGAQAALIPWAAIWAQTKDTAIALGTYLAGLAVDFQTWLGAQVALIDWAAVWAQVKLTATQVIDAVAVAVGALDAELTRWLQTQLETTDWKALGVSFGQFFGEALVGGGQTAVDGLGPQLKPETLRKALGDFFTGVFDGLWADLGPVISKGFSTMLSNAIRSATPLRPNWWPTQVPWPFGPQAGSGMEFPVTPGGLPGQTQAPGGSSRGSSAPSQMSSGPISNESSQAEKIARAKQLAIERGLDPERMAAQLMQESSFNIGAVSSAGARGIGQFMPSTGKTYADKLGVSYEQMVNSAELSIQAATMHMQDLTAQFSGDQTRAESAYFSGPGGGVHPEYTNAVSSRLPEVRGVPAATSSGTTQPMSAPSSGGGVTGATVTYKDQWDNVFTVPEAGFNDRANMPGGNSDVTEISRSAGQKAAASAGQATKSPAVNMSTFGQSQAIGNQFELGLSPDAAAAACGPAAVALFVAATGRTPNRDEVMRISAKNGWTAGAGMGGFGAFQGAVSDLGVNAASIPIDQAGASAASGHLTAISTGGGNVPLSSGHYFAAQGFNQETQQFDLGETGGPDPTNPNAAHALRGGSRFMTMQEIVALAGPVNGVLQVLDQIPPAVETATAPLPALSAGIQAVGEQTAVAAPGIVATTDALVTVPPAVEAVGSSFLGLPGIIQPAVDEASAGVLTAFDMMGQGALTSVTSLGDGVLTTTQTMAGGTIATVTDMAGQVTNQSATLANGVSLNMSDMGIQTTTSVNEMAGTVTTLVTDLAGNAISTTTNMQGQVVSQFTTMSTTGSSAVTTLGTTAVTQFGNAGKGATGLIPPIQAAGEAIKSIPQVNMTDTVSQFGKATTAANAYTKALVAAAKASEDLKGSGGGSKSGSGKSSGLEKGAGASGDFKAAGGWAEGMTMVGELGPELASFNRPTWITTAAQTRNLMSGGGSGGYGSGGGTTIVVNVNVEGSVTSENDLVDAVRSGLIAIGRRNGGLDVLDGG